MTKTSMPADLAETSAAFLEARKRSRELIREGQKLIREARQIHVRTLLAHATAILHEEANDDSVTYTLLLKDKPQRLLVGDMDAPEDLTERVYQRVRPLLMDEIYEFPVLTVKPAS